MDAEPKTIEVTLQKGSKGLGLSIVAAKVLLFFFHPNSKARPE